MASVHRQYDEPEACTPVDFDAAKVELNNCVNIKLPYGGRHRQILPCTFIYVSTRCSIGQTATVSYQLHPDTICDDRVLVFFPKVGECWRTIMNGSRWGCPFTTRGQATSIEFEERLEHLEAVGVWGVRSTFCAWDYSILDSSLLDDLIYFYLCARNIMYWRSFFTEYWVFIPNYLVNTPVTGFFTQWSFYVFILPWSPEMHWLSDILSVASEELTQRLLTPCRKL